MGIRSLTTFIETYVDDKEKKHTTKIVTMYKQMDGYPSGYGKELAGFLARGKMVSGISVGEKEIVFNGMGCLSAQVVAHFKEGAGGIYLHRGGTTDCGEEYRYEILFDGKRLTMKAIEVGWKTKDKVIFDGSPSEFEQWVEIGVLK